MNSEPLDGPVGYRLARLAEADHLARLSRRLIEYDLPWWCWTPKRLRHSMQRPDNVTLIAEHRVNVLGFALMSFGEEHAHLNLLAVEPASRRQGIGRSLVGWLEESCTVAGVARVFLEVRAANLSARRFYRGLGYTEIDHLENYYCGQEAAVRMMHDLRRVGGRPVA